MLRYVSFQMLYISTALRSISSGCSFFLYEISRPQGHNKKSTCFDSLTFWKVNFVPEDNIHVNESTCTSHCNRTSSVCITTQPAMYFRSAIRTQKRIRSDCDLDVIYDVTGDTGRILGVPDLQPGSGAQISAISRPSGTFTWRFLQAGSRGQNLHHRYI